MGSYDGEVTLCCLLWAHDGMSTGLTTYEDRVLALIPEHGGQVVQRVLGEGLHGDPHEVQILRFTSQEMLDSFLADPRRVALASERDRVIKRTELFPIRIL